MTEKGWDEIIDPVLKAAKANNVAILQVKEKFGGLRIYLGQAPDWLHDLCYLAERLSYHVCERCGKEGKVREDRGWLKTLCEECNND